MPSSRGGPSKPLRNRPFFHFSTRHNPHVIPCCTSTQERNDITSTFGNGPARRSILFSFSLFDSARPGTYIDEMPDMDDMQLLREYAWGRSEQAFTTLVSRHLGLVHSVALRQVANSSQAEEITQAVFIILARKAEKLRPGTILAGWLFNTTRLTAANFIRDQSRRRRHEQEAAMQSQIQESGTDVWRRLAPLLDEAVADLNEADRNAILLRFMKGHDFKSISAATGASEDSVRMRVNRALEAAEIFRAPRGFTVGRAHHGNAVRQHGAGRASGPTRLRLNSGPGQG